MMGCREIKEGEFSLLYCTSGEDKAVALTPEQHDMLQLLLRGLPGEITVLKDVSVSFNKVNGSKSVVNGKATRTEGFSACNPVNTSSPPGGNRGPL